MIFGENIATGRFATAAGGRAVRRVQRRTAAAAAVVPAAAAPPTDPTVVSSGGVAVAASSVSAGAAALPIEDDHMLAADVLTSLTLSTPPPRPTPGTLTLAPPTLVLPPAASATPAASSSLSVNLKRTRVSPTKKAGEDVAQALNLIAANQSRALDDSPQSKLNKVLSHFGQFRLDMRVQDRLLVKKLLAKHPEHVTVYLSCSSNPVELDAFIDDLLSGDA